MNKIRQWIVQIRGQKHVEYEDLDRIVRYCLSKYGSLFPSYRETKNGSRVVHHFNVVGVYPISLEKPHGNREFIPPKYARYALDGLEEVASYIELNVKEPIDDDGDEQGSTENAG